MKSELVGRYDGFWVYHGQPGADGLAALGHLVIESDRHVPYLADLSDAEAAALSLQSTPRGTLRVHSRTLFGIKISDTQCGFRAFSSSVFPALRWEASDYAVESEMLIRMARARLAYVAVPIATVYHDRYKGTQPLDGLRILRQLVVWRLRA